MGKCVPAGKKTGGVVVDAPAPAKKSRAATQAVSEAQADGRRSAREKWQLTSLQAKASQ